MSIISDNLIIIIEDARGLRTWQTLIDIVSKCFCRMPRHIEEIRSLRGPLEGMRLVKTIKALKLRYPNSTIIVAFDTDRYGGSEHAGGKLYSDLSRYFSDRDKNLIILPVIEKLEDWVYAILEGKTCRCCGIEKLSRVINTKYEKYMMATRIPNLLRSRHKNVCENLTAKRWLLDSTGIKYLLNILCREYMIK